VGAENGDKHQVKFKRRPSRAATNNLDSDKMFIGEFRHVLDDKGRLAIPVKFREAFKDGAVVTRGLDQCLFVFPMTEWQKLAERLANLPLSQQDSRAFARLMLAGAMDVELDKQGRMVVPEYLRTYAAVGKDAVVTGLYNRLEIWDAKAWETYQTQTEKDSAVIAERMSDLGI
jgi:MraZ protein